MRACALGSGALMIQRIPPPPTPALSGLIPLAGSPSPPRRKCTEEWVPRLVRDGFTGAPTVSPSGVGGGGGRRGD